MIDLFPAEFVSCSDDGTVRHFDWFVCFEILRQHDPLNAFAPYDSGTGRELESIEVNEKLRFEMFFPLFPADAERCITACVVWCARMVSA